MAITAVTEVWVEGSKRRCRGTITLTSSYAAGGEALTAAALGLSVLEGVEIEPRAGYLPTYLPSTGKVLVFLAPDAPLSASTTAALSTAVASTHNLATYALPANALGAAGMGVRLLAWGGSAAETTGRAVGITFGTTSVIAATATTSGAAWRLQADVLRVGATTQLSSGVGGFHASAVQVINATPGATLSTAITVAVTAQVTSGASGVVSLAGFVVTLLGPTGTGALVEVPAATDLSGTAFTFNATGV